MKKLNVGEEFQKIVDETLYPNELEQLMKYATEIKEAFETKKGIRLKGVNGGLFKLFMRSLAYAQAK